MKKRIALVVLAVGLVALAAGLTMPALSAQQSSLASLFDRYDVKPNFGQVNGSPAWGGLTSWVAADGKGSVIVMVRTAPYFRVLTREGQPVKTWGDAGLFNQAHSLHFGPDGSIWATDPNDHVIHKFGPDGKIVLTLGKKGVPGDDTSHDAFNRPNAVAFGPGGEIYVSDGYVNSRIVQFTSDGKFVRIIGGKKGSGPGELQLPHGVAIDQQGRIIVADSDNKRLSVFSKEGVFIKTLAAPSRGGLVITPDGTLYVSDVNAGAVTVFKNDQIIDVIKVEGRPHGLSVDPVTGDVYTSSSVGESPNVTKAILKKPAAPK
jgi:DNA-binding beta-propeller fold protein YncE